MGIFTNGDSDEDQLFDLVMINKMTGGGSGGNHSGGGCLSCLVLIVTIPAAVVVGVISLLS